MTLLDSSPVLPTFDTFDLPDSLVRKLAQQEIVNPSPIQQAVIPAALEGHNVLGRARTGSHQDVGLPGSLSQTSKK